MNQPSMLELATMQELFDEITRRTESAVLVIADEPRNIPDHIGARMYFSNGWVNALGLSSWAVSKLNDPQSFVNIRNTP